MKMNGTKWEGVSMSGLLDARVRRNKMECEGMEWGGEKWEPMQ